MKIAILLTAWKEADSIGKCVDSLVANVNVKFVLILGCPDQETYSAARSKCEELGIVDKLVHVQDPGRGKPTALAMMMDEAAKMDCDYWAYADGDVYYAPGALDSLLAGFTSSEIWAVTGQPVSADPKDNMMGYYGHLLTSAAHHKRMIDLTPRPDGRGANLVKKREFFPVSGYLFMTRPLDFRAPHDTLVEDAYISYEINRRGGKIGYAPEAKVFVKFPTTLADYFKQKKRSVGGYVQLWKYGFVTKKNNTRSLGRELEYFWFPLTYARGLREFGWSLLLYPVRLWLWAIIFWERKILNKSFLDTWVRVETTK